MLIQSWGLAQDGLGVGQSGDCTIIRTNPTKKIPTLIGTDSCLSLSGQGQQTARWSTDTLNSERWSEYQ